MIPVRKRWGQHFLAGFATAERIVDAARVGPDDTVVEVGPGDGALTRPLASRGARVLAIEIDPRRAEELVREFAGNDRIRVLAGDALERSLSAWLGEAGWVAPAVFVSNLPYNVGTPVLTGAIEDPGVVRAVATVQREVARRFVARPGDDAYGFLSVRTAAFATGRILFDLPPAAFRPRPRVASSVLELAPRLPALDPELRRRALALASLAFRQRRKTLGNALASDGGRDSWQEVLAALGRPPTVRAEELSLEDYLELARRRP